MSNTIDNNIFIDRLTGLPNFFKFIESDIRDIFNKNGSIIIFDMVAFEKVNNTYGKDFGDICLKNLSEIIVDVVAWCNNSSVFRTDGDEFTVILPQIPYVEAEKLSMKIRERLKYFMIKGGFNEVDVRALTLDYFDGISSINQFYKMIFENTIEKIKIGEDKLVKDGWLEHIIGSFTKRIKETLSFFNDAYNLALTDDISGLPNSRAARLYLSSIKSSNEEFSILFIDGDNLRRYNSISYKAGNEMIQKLSSIIRSSLRREDKIFRWLSGDEFLVVLERVSYEECIVLGNRIRLQVEKGTKEWVYPVTVSIGVSNYPKDSYCIEEIIDKAEKANCNAKNSGKNMVVRWSDIRQSM